ncbi:MAG: methionine biosynthesis protein MetW, partial [Alphaproteobacteria bacterium]
MRPDIQIIVDLVEAHQRVLDVGCGDGLLLQRLRDEKQVDAR